MSVIAHPDSIVQSDGLGPLSRGMSILARVPGFGQFISDSRFDVAIQAAKGQQFDFAGMFRSLYDLADKQSYGSGDAQLVHKAVEALRQSLFSYDEEYDQQRAARALAAFQSAYVDIKDPRTRSVLDVMHMVACCDRNPTQMSAEAGRLHVEVADRLKVIRDLRPQGSLIERIAAIVHSRRLSPAVAFDEVADLLERRVPGSDLANTLADTVKRLRGVESEGAGRESYPFPGVRSAAQEREKALQAMPNLIRHLGRDELQYAYWILMRISHVSWNQSQVGTQEMWRWPGEVLKRH